MKNSSGCLHRTAIFGFFLVLLLLPPFARAQTTGSANCIGGLPDSFHEFQSGRCVLVEYTEKNTSGKKIVGLVFNATLSDATEHWKWVSLMFPSNMLRIATYAIVWRMTRYNHPMLRAARQ